MRRIYAVIWALRSHSTERKIGVSFDFFQLYFRYEKQQQTFYYVVKETWGGSSEVLRSPWMNYIVRENLHLVKEKKSSAELSFIDIVNYRQNRKLKCTLEFLVELESTIQFNHTVWPINFCFEHHPYVQ